MAHAKPPTTQDKFRLFVRYTFRTQAAALSHRDVSAIEHLLRKGRRQLETFEDGTVKDVWVSSEMRAWEREHAHSVRWPEPSSSSSRSQ